MTQPVERPPVPKIQPDGEFLPGLVMSVNGDAKQDAERSPIPNKGQNVLKIARNFFEKREGVIF